MLRRLLNLFKRKPKLVYSCYLTRQGVFAIIEKNTIENSVSEHNINPIERGEFICNLKLNQLPLHKNEKAVLKKCGALYFYENQKNKLTTFEEIYEKITNIKG